MTQFQGPCLLVSGRVVWTITAIPHTNKCTCRVLVAYPTYHSFIVFQLTWIASHSVCWQVGAGLFGMAFLTVCMQLNLQLPTCVGRNDDWCQGVSPTLYQKARLVQWNRDATCINIIYYIRWQWYIYIFTLAVLHIRRHMSSYAFCHANEYMM